MKKKITFIFTLILFCGNIVIGQDSLSREVIPFPKMIFTFSPLNTINLRVPAAQFGVEYRIANQLSLQHEFGYLLPYKNNGSQFLKKKGFRFRNELRWYHNGMDEKRQKDYFGLQFRYWKFTSPMTSFFFREGGQYQQRINFKVKQSAIGGGISYGSNVISHKKFVLDFGFSAGFIQLKNRPEGIPEDAERFDDFALFGRNHSRSYDSTQPYFLITSKIGFAL